MKKHCRRVVLIVFIALAFLPDIAAQGIPRPVGFVNDFAGVMTTGDKQTVNELAAAVKEKTGAEMAVVTVKSFTPYASIEDYSLALAEDWGIGEKDKDSGVLLILATEERKIRIEVGYGLEGAIPDSAVGRIIDNFIIPAFREGDFSGGLAEGSRAIAAYIAKEKGVNLDGYDLPEPKGTGSSDFSESIILLIVVIWVVFFVLFPLIFRSRRGGRGYRYGGFGSGGGFSSSGGGFGGFGGGSFGGGGASRGF